MIQPTHSQLAERLDKGAAQFMEINEQLADIASKLEVLPEMQRDIAATKDLVEAWTTAKNVARFIKWVGAIAAAFAAIFVMMKAGASAFVEWGGK